ncbi:MAG: hypothetical protein ACM3MI_11170, partial [Clostridiales bacterium]
LFLLLLHGFYYLPLLRDNNSLLYLVKYNLSNYNLSESHLGRDLKPSLIMTFFLYGLSIL